MRNSGPTSGRFRERNASATTAQRPSASPERCQSVSRANHCSRGVTRRRLRARAPRVSLRGNCSFDRVTCKPYDYLIFYVLSSYTLLRSVLLLWIAKQTPPRWQRD